MGENVTRGNRGTEDTEKRGSAGSAEIGAGSESSDTTRTRAGTGTGTGTRTRAEEKKKPERMAMVEEEKKEARKQVKQKEPIKINLNQTAEQVTEQKDKPKKQRKPRKKVGIKADDLDALLLPVFDLVGARPGCEHWKLKQTELRNITQPLAAIINKNDTLGKIAQNSDELALVVACVSIFAPRAMMSAKIRKTKKETKEKNYNVGNKLETSGTGKSTNRSDDRKNAAADKTASSIMDSIGQPIF